MSDRYDPQHPAPWSPFPPDRAAGGQYQDYPTTLGEPLGATRSDGLRRLSRLTWRATQLGALTTLGFATLFARSAPAATVASHPAPKATVKPSAHAHAPTPTPSPHRHRHHPHHKPAAVPVPSSPAPAPAPTLAPPTTPPAPPPPSPAPSPVHSTSSPSHGGG